MRSFRVVTLLATLAATGCATPHAIQNDRLCSELSAFVAASSTAKESSVVLRGGWGGDTKDTLMTHDCQFFGSDSGKRFCDYLVQNTSWEFGGHNLNRLATCLNDSAADRALDRAGESELPVEISTATSQGVINLHYTPASMSSGLYTLSITVPHDGE